MKINFKQPKYMIPAIAFFPVVFIGYQVISIFDFEVEKEDKPVQTDGINIEMPKVNIDKELKSKYQNMMDDMGKVKDHVAVQNLDEETTNPSDATSSVYTEEDLQMLDSLERVKQQNLEEIKRMNEELSKRGEDKADIESSQKNAVKSETEALAEQLEMLQKVASGEYKSPEQIKKEEEEKKQREALLRKKEEEALKNAPKEVVKASSDNESYFNTVGKKEDDTHLIKAMVDETLKLYDGSRLRLRLLDDIILDGNVIKSGSYLYATVTGFGAQRIRCKVNSIFVNDIHIKVSLNVFDVDAIEGIYVPQSKFRDLAKEAAASAMGQSVSFNQTTGEQDLESLAFQTLQSVYQSATSAVANNIKKNKAKVKYSTIVYLINDKNN